MYNFALAFVLCAVAYIIGDVVSTMDGISETDRIGRIAAAPCAACGKGLTNCAGYHEGQC